MARRPIHVHIHGAPTQDNHWEENKHPRAPDGKFGHGGKSEGSNAHKLLDPGFAKTMDPGQRALSGIKSGPALGKGEISHAGHILAPVGGGRYNVYPHAPGKKVAPIASGLPLEQAKAAAQAASPAAKKEEAENIAKGLEAAEQKREKFAKMHIGTRVRVTRSLTGQEEEGIFSGLDQHGQALVTIRGRTLTFHPSKVTEAYPKK